MNTCPHGYTPPNCPTTGCESSRPAVLLEDWIRHSTEPRTPSMDLAPPRIPVAPLTDEERRERERLGRERAKQVDALARRDTATGDLTRGKGFIGVQEDGRKAEGSSTWEWRPPLPSPVRGHDEMALQCNGIASGYQPAPPVHVPGAVPGSAKDMRRHIRTLSETAAERILFAQEADRVPRTVAAEVLGMTKDQLRRAITKRNKGER